MTVDLHCHTTASDGSLTPAETVARARHVGLKGVGITDHDTVNGIPEALVAGQELGIVVVPGVELNTDFKGTEIHILGYYPDLESEGFQQALVELREARLKRVKLIVEKLAKLGLPLEEDRLLAIAGDGAVGRPHVAQAMYEAGYVQNIREAFEYYLGQGRPGYVSRFKLTPAEGIRLLTGAGAVPVLAHPGIAKLDDIIPGLVEVGLKGIEVFHPNHDKQLEQRYVGLTKKLGLIMTGGSDYHGPSRKEGIELGAKTVDMAVILELQKLK